MAFALTALHRVCTFVQPGVCLVESRWVGADVWPRDMSFILHYKLLLLVHQPLLFCRLTTKPTEIPSSLHVPKAPHRACIEYSKLTSARPRQSRDGGPPPVLLIHRYLVFNKNAFRLVQEGGVSSWPLRCPHSASCHSIKNSSLSVAGI